MALTATMLPEKSKIKARLEEVLEMILCPVSGCWPIHGCRFEYFHDEDDYHFLEVWPVAVEEEDDHQGNGHQRTDKGLLYELAEFDFSELHKEVPLEYLHFSQRRQIFEIGWKEFGKDLELQVHIEPEEVEAD
jgi:hypothetical protein